jgi:putative ABC transport system substrate-binding protein
MMNRRTLIALVGGAFLDLPSQVRSQQPGRTYRIGGLLSTPREAPQIIALFNELRRLGFIEGQNLIIDPRGFGLRREQFLQGAVELVNAHVDVILAGGNTAIRAAQQATTTLPILGVTDDMVGSGLAASMAHPGANTTGVSLLATELDGKRQELLTELIPAARHIAALADPNTTAPGQLQALQEAARTHGVNLDIRTAAAPEEIKPAIDSAKASGAAGLNVLASPVLFANRQIIFERAAAVHLPAIYQWPEMAREGGFAGYGPSIVRLFRDVVNRQLVKLLEGAKPADLPVEQPTRFELVINLNTAKELGLTSRNRPLAALEKPRDCTYAMGAS